MRSRTLARGVVGLLALLALGAAIAVAKKRPPQTTHKTPDAAPAAKKKPPMSVTSTNEFEAAVAALSAHATWCDGAKALSGLGDPRALGPLVRAYDTPIEGADKGCLLRAMKSLATREVVLGLAADTDGEARRVAMRLMAFYPDAAYLQPIERAIGDLDPKVRPQALRAVAAQYQTPEWETLLIRLLDSSDSAARKTARESLGRRDTATARQALAGHPAK